MFGPHYVVSCFTLFTPSNALPLTDCAADELLLTFALDIDNYFSPFELLIMSDKAVSRSAYVDPISHTCERLAKPVFC